MSLRHTAQRAQRALLRHASPLQLQNCAGLPENSFRCIDDACAQVQNQSSQGFSTLPTNEQRAALLKQLLVDTLGLVKKFESIGLSREASEELTRHITDLILTNKMRMEETFVAKQTLEKVILEQQALLTGFKSEIQKAADMQHAHVHKELERQQSFLDKMRTEVKHEIDKLTASQRLDMNLEKGRMRDDLQIIRDKTTELEIKVDRDINELKSSVEKAKNDTIKSVITILGTFSAIAFTISRFMQMGAGGG